MAVVIFVFLTAALILWLAVFGYLLVLGAVAWRRCKATTRKSELPTIAVVVPTLNEEHLILSKLADLRRTDYPDERISVIVVDGGSNDQTVAFVEREIEHGAEIQLVRLEGALAKGDQISCVFSQLHQEIAVVTDADAVLEPSCIRELVELLCGDSRTALVGATVRPRSVLPEERTYWWLQNCLWWLEGEVLSSGAVAGVCYAFKRKMVKAPLRTVVADDAHLALAASARGWRVRICRTAQATEMRVPQTLKEMFAFRRRRGAAYLAELQHPKLPPVPFGYRLARHVRLWHLRVTPKIGVVLMFSAAVLLWTSYWPLTLAAFAAFAAPAVVAVSASTTLAEYRWWRLSLAAARLVGLLWATLVAINRHTTRVEGNHVSGSPPQDGVSVSGASLPITASVRRRNQLAQRL